MNEALTVVQGKKQRDKTRPSGGERDAGDVRLMTDVSVLLKSMRRKAK